MLIFSILTTSPTPFLRYVTWFLLGFYIYLIYQPSSSQKCFHISRFFHNLVENRVEIVHNFFSLFFST